MNSRPRIYLFTDFGLSGPYVGQMIDAIYQEDDELGVISLMHDAPSMRPQPAAYLLAAVTRRLIAPCVVVCVVDPGVGGERLPLAVKSRNRLFVGPDNGLMARLPEIDGVERIDWQPPCLSSSFHGRDLFAPVGARLAAGKLVAATPIGVEEIVGFDWPGELAEIIYVDGYGNLMTGLSADGFGQDRRIKLLDKLIPYAPTFCGVPAGELFWYGNSQGLIEIAANGVSASALLGVAAGNKILVI